MLMGCSFQLFIGRLYTFYSPKKVFLTCIFLFEVGSGICGAAPNSPVFIVGRAVAGLGASGMFGGAIVLTMDVVPLHKRPVFVSLNGAIFGVSSVVGPCKTSSSSLFPKFDSSYSANVFAFSAWRRSNHERDLEVVLLHQPTGRRCHDGHSLLHSQSASSEERKPDLQGTSGSTGHTRHIHLRSLYGVSLACSAMGWLDLSME